LSVFKISEFIISEAIAIAQLAGDAVMEVYRAYQIDASIKSAIVISNKSDDSPLTKADMLSHDLIVKHLTRLTPDIPIVSEESYEKNTVFHSDLFWLIDPIDGTKEFLSRNNEFTVNIALICKSQSVFGIVLAPALDILYWGGHGLGAFRITERQIHESISVKSDFPSNSMVRVIASKSHLNEETSCFIKKLGHSELYSVGSSLKFCRVAEGAADIYPRMGPTCEWDTAAAQAVLEAAGGCVLKLDGESVHYGKENILNPFFVAASRPFFDFIQKDSDCCE
jgi:3'(2'), 5'-bisphosphate nucleotidase